MQTFALNILRFFCEKSTN